MAIKDEELVREILNGNQSSMEVLVNRYYKLIHAVIYRNFGDYHIAMDLTQETFVKTLRKLETFEIDKGDFKGWILKIAINTSKDYYKSSYVKHNLPHESQSVYFSKETSEKDNIINILEKKEKRLQVKNAILSLPYEQRLALILRYYHDLKIKNIGDITDTNESTVKSRLRLGIEKLKKLLDRGEKNEKFKKEI
ncbi:RNA polymerase sigma factor, sigma-70 family [Gottschalkia purinilytica]|uniref:RNA polymerase sigma factor, sigma-70 family n=1 Tax=Gottschalkia purinilytica TaxID=1503 RepID=A0A0L0WA71_GOTPU|nr:RNA polymerase sigma factor [Gottschalkia purinilytica]KNF08322.1 RNA polymerase sigma factor, sigma-70 family [Gottschalkia purinilytica]